MTGCTSRAVLSSKGAIHYSLVVWGVLGLLCIQLHNCSATNSRTDDSDGILKGVVKTTGGNNTAHVAKIECPDFLIGTGTELGEILAWHSLQGLHASLHTATTGQIRFWSNKDNTCLLEDCATLSKRYRALLLPSSESTLELCRPRACLRPSSKQLTHPRACQKLKETSITRHNLETSHQAAEVTVSPLKKAAHCIAGVNATAVMASSPLCDRSAAAVEFSASSAAQQAGQDTGLLRTPWWWSSRHREAGHNRQSAGPRQHRRLGKGKQLPGDSLQDALAVQPDYLVHYSTSYLHSAIARHRLHQQTPDAHILVILTEPVTQVLTQFNKLWLRQHAVASFNAKPAGENVSSVVLGQRQCDQWLQTLIANITSQVSYLGSCQRTKHQGVSNVSSCRHHADAHSHWQVVQQGVYAGSLKEWLDLFPASQLLIWTSEGLQADPAGHLKQLLAWLGLSSSALIHQQVQQQAQLEKGLGELMHLVTQPPQHLLITLQNFFEPQKQQLINLLEQKGLVSAAAEIREFWKYKPAGQWSVMSHTSCLLSAALTPTSATPTASSTSRLFNNISTSSDLYPLLEVITDVLPDAPLLPIPQSFLGISHEWRYIESINNIPGYKDVLKLLSSYGSNPLIIRVGGGSTDKQDTVPTTEVFQALKQVHVEVGVQYILGLNFLKGDVELARAQWQQARTQLPVEAILTFEIGNEPNYYEGFKHNKTALQYVRCCLIDDWSAFAKRLSCPCGRQHCCSYNKFAGPVWGHINVYPSTITWFLKASHSYINLTTVHWYKATKETHNTPVTLLAEHPLRKEMTHLRKLVEASQNFSKPLRVAEMNSISNSGRDGVSNVFAAALWTLDACFEVAAAGAVGVNLHQGSGQSLYTALVRRYHNNGKTLAPVVLKPPFYAMLMFQQAVRNGSVLLSQQPQPTQNSTGAMLRHIKLWPLLDVSSGQLRSVVINKHATRSGLQHVCLSDKRSGVYASNARVTRLLAPGDDPLSARKGITLGGQQYAVGGTQRGENVVEHIRRRSLWPGKACWQVYMPAGSAAMVEVDRTEAVLHT